MQRKPEVVILNDGESKRKTLKTTSFWREEHQRLEFKVPTWRENIFDINYNSVVLRESFLFGSEKQSIKVAHKQHSIMELLMEYLFTTRVNPKLTLIFLIWTLYFN